ncbi:MAG: c-type cytochrome [Verrucomicrobiales bacterium]|nr:c-type cytochrome [Verrucomicrobiales bacterium]
MMNWYSTRNIGLLLLALAGGRGSAWTAEPAGAAEVVAERWSGALNVPDPVAVSVDPQGRVYVTSTTRRKAADLDIRQHTDWIPADLGLDSVEAKRAFLKEALAPGKLRGPQGDLADHNGDGSVDWRDLTVPSERIYQLRDEDGDGRADRITVFAEGFNTEVTGIAAGILYHDGWVYVTVAPDLWRLRDTDDDGVADEREVVVHGFGHHIAYAGHDMHGPRLGVDGRIYWSIGDKGVNVTRRDDGQVLYFPHEGCVMRVEPDGTGFEVFAHGLRNVQEVAFDAEGRIFGVDNDSDLPTEKERVVWVVEGSDAGWRCTHQYMRNELHRDSRWMRERIWELENDEQPLFVLPPLAHSRNGPAGFIWEPGTALGAAFRGQFLLDQFPSGDMSALRIERTSSGFVQAEERLVHRGLMGIGMAWGPEGAAYLADWDGGYPLDQKGAVWRVDATTDRDEAARAEVQALLRAGMAERTEEELTKLLGQADQRVRLAAQLELVRRGRWEALRQVAEDETAATMARLHALWGLGIGWRRGQTEVKQTAQLLRAEAVELRWNVAKMLGDAPQLGVAFGAELIAALEDSDFEVRLQSAIALGKLRVSAATDALLRQAAADGGEPALRGALAGALAGCASSAQLTAAATAPDWTTRACALLALARQQDPAVARFLTDENPRLVEEAARAILDDAGQPALWAEVAALCDRASSLTEATLLRAMNAAFRVGGPIQAERLTTLALDETLPDSMRRDALAYLAMWQQPPALDWLDGRPRKLEQRSAAGAQEALAPHAGVLLAQKDASLRTAALETLLALRVPVAFDLLRQIVLDAATAESVRVEALGLLLDQHADAAGLPELLSQLVATDVPDALKGVAMRQWSQVQPEAFAQAFETVWQEMGVRGRQALLADAAQMTDPPDALRTWVEKALARLVEKKTSMDTALDLLETATAWASLDPKLPPLLAAWEAARPASAVPGLPPLREELLKGGDEKLGREIVASDLAANCTACHRVESKEGSTVGPPLLSIGKTKDRPYLLEALLQPSATLAPGFGLVNLTLKNGTALTGTVAEEDGPSLTLRLPDGAEQVIAAKDVASRTPPISVMPPMLGILSPRQIRDVVAYLATLKKTDKSAPASEH